MLRDQSKGLGKPSVGKIGDEFTDSALKALLVRNGIQGVGELVDDHVPFPGDGVQVFARSDVDAGFVVIPIRGSVFLEGGQYQWDAVLYSWYGQGDGRLRTWRRFIFKLLMTASTPMRFAGALRMPVNRSMTC